MPPHQLLLGVALAVMAALLFAAVDTVTKVLTASHGSPVTLVAWARSTVHLVLMTALLAPSTGGDGSRRRARCRCSCAR